jgi:hypothetical protein
MSSNVLLMTVEDIKERTGVHANVDPKPIRADIKYCQDAFILPIIGTALMNKLQTDIAGAGTAGIYDTLLKSYIFDALMYYVFSETTSMVTLQLYNKGLIKKTNENTQLADLQEVIQTEDKLKKRAEFYGQKLTDYLMEQYTAIPEYLNPGNTYDTVRPEGEAYTTTFDLGDDCGCDDKFYLPRSDSNFKIFPK